ncbi:MAG: DUF3572 domain-containing protein [Hyphomicrobiales bacterium]|nr:DUF3572 domain-containing protein [Hyphomicrobiales bacterium]
MLPSDHDNRTETQNRAETLAALALAYLADHPSDLDRFFALTGLTPGSLRQSASDPSFVVGVLDYMLGDERLLTNFAARADIAPESVAEARRRLTRDDS